MFAMGRNAVNAYASVRTETGVMAADPHQLVQMLFEGALIALSDARRHMANNTTAAKGAAVSKAIAIIRDGLKASLDVEAGGELAQRLSALYDYMGTRLLVANLHNSPQLIAEVSSLLSQLRDAWEQIKPVVPSAPQIAQTPQTPSAPQSTVRSVGAVYSRV